MAQAATFRAFGAARLSFDAATTSLGYFSRCPFHGLQLQKRLLDYSLNNFRRHDEDQRLITEARSANHYFLTHTHA